jgi:hypothetical protein
MRVLWQQRAGISIGKHFKKIVVVVLEWWAISPIEIIFPLTID